MPLVVSCGTVTVLLLLIKKMDMWVVWSLTKPYLKDLACLNFNSWDSKFSIFVINNANLLLYFHWDVNKYQPDSYFVHVFNPKIKLPRPGSTG